MTVSSINVTDEYLGDGLNVNFPITFNYIDPSTIKIYVDDVLQSEGVDYSLDNVLLPTEVNFNAAPIVGAEVSIRRESTLTQDTNLSPNETYSSRAESIEDQFDRTILLLQEVKSLVTGPAAPVVTPSGVIAFPDWQQSTAYVKGQAVKAEGSNWICLIDHSSGTVDILADVGLGRWEKLAQGEQGEQGNQGIQGPVGPSGANGLNGANGANGADGIFSQIANTAEAVTGTDDTKGMTPLKTSQAIAAQVPNLPVVTGLLSSISVLNSSLGEIGTRLSAVENNQKLSIGKFSGSQWLLNNQVAPIELKGALYGPGGAGASFEVNDTGAEFANVQIYIKRVSDGATVSFSSFKINMHFVNGVWYISREETFILEESLDVDGITLSVATDIDGVGQLSYTSSNIAGAYEEEESYIAWLGQEIIRGSLP